MSLAIMLPLSFAGLGIREGTLVFLFAQYGIRPDISMALSLLFFSRNVATSLAGGFIEFKNLIFTGRPAGEKDPSALKINKESL
jgi:hypothetical protein